VTNSVALPFSILAAIREEQDGDFGPKCGPVVDIYAYGADARSYAGSPVAVAAVTPWPILFVKAMKYS
jgi:hypothetical protein